MIEINKDLKKYIEENIFSMYKLNEKGHGIEHIKYVINRSFEFVKDNNLPVDNNIVYVVAAYHDIGHHIDAHNHEKISAEILKNDKQLRTYFSEKEIKLISEAIEDHRASMEDDPRSIYGKIVSTADRETRVDVQLQRMYEYRLEHYRDKSLEWMIEDTRQYIINKFGKKGYATQKIFFEDKAYKKFLDNISKLAENKEGFRKKFLETNNIMI